MSILMIILGAIMVVFGLSCMFTPLVTFMNAGYLIVIIVAVYGVIGIIKGIKEKKYGVSFVFSILSVIFGLAVLFYPGLVLLADGVLIYMAAAWFILQGIVSVYTALTLTKSTGSKFWIFQLIFGIIGILLGFYSFFHPMLLAFSIGFLIGFYFAETGFTLIFDSAKTKE